MKRFWCIALCAMTALCLLACGKKDAQGSETGGSEGAQGTKIGIITGSETATPEAYYAAKAQ